MKYFLIARSYQALVVNINILSVSVLACLEERLKVPILARWFLVFMELLKRRISSIYSILSVCRGLIKELSSFFLTLQLITTVTNPALHEVCFYSKILQCSCDKHHKFDHGWSSFPGDGSQSSTLAVFWRFLGHFSSCLFWYNPLA